MHCTQLNQSYAIKIIKPKIQMNPIEKKTHPDNIYPNSHNP